MNYRVGQLEFEVFAGRRNGNTVEITKHYNASVNTKLGLMTREDLLDLKYGTDKALRELDKKCKRS